MSRSEDSGQISSASEHYESASCGLYDAAVCRSCSLLAVSGGSRIKTKELSILRALKKFDLHPGKVDPIVIPSRVWGSRAKVKMSVAGTTESPIIGIIRSDRSPVELAACPLSPAPFQSLLETVRAHIHKASLTPYNIEARTGELKGLIIMGSSSLDEGALRFVLRSTEAIPRIKKILPDLRVQHPWLKVVSCNIQPLPAALLEGPEEIILTEDTSIRSSYGAASLRFSPQAFMQVTPEVASALYSTAREWASQGPCGDALDLFCGVGGFSLSLAGLCCSVTGVEVSESAVLSARLSAQEQGSATAMQFIAGDAEAVLQTLRERSFGLVVTNPPRRGLSAPLVSQIEAFRPHRIIYSSCNPDTFCRDVAMWRSSYSLTRVAPFDMFPLTEHCEVLGLLERK